MQIPLLFGPYGSGALAHAKALLAHGANAIWFHGFNAAAFETCAREGLIPCVEFKTFRADFDTHPELIPIGADGAPIRYGRLVQGVCLSNEAFLEETEAHLLEGVRTYQPGGIWLDYLTYAGWFETPQPDLQESCFCPRCIADFCASTGIDATTPAAILAQHGAAWTAHKCARIAAFGAHYAALIRAHLPNCVVGSYMCPWTPDEYDGALRRIFAQDYALLAPAIDVFTPLIYAHKSGRAPAWARTLLEASPAFVPPDHKMQLILDVLDYPASLQATAASRVPSWGVQLFGGAEVFADPARARIFHAQVSRIRDAIATGQRP
ncbi:MAG: hypothetical protein JXA09_15385 [Anaerolineae bacterium]|nr:hypothetical protein [Anaerolineae bacterium]